MVTWLVWGLLLRAMLPSDHCSCKRRNDQQARPIPRSAVLLSMTVKLTVEPHLRSEL